MFEEILDLKDCVCGKDHTLRTRDYIVEKDAVLILPELLDRLFPGKKYLAVFDNNTYDAAFPKISKVLPDLDCLILEGDPVHPDERQLDTVAAALKESGYDYMLAVGSGVICDIVRYVAYLEDVPFVSVPTAASVDGFVSDNAALSRNGGKVTVPAKAPAAVVADLEIIAAAPMKMTASGVGDMLSKYISIADWKIGHLITGEYYCPAVADLTLEAVRIIVDNIDSIAKGDIDSIGELMKGLLLSGITIQMVGITRPASSFEHHFSHYLEVVPIDSVDALALHGEKVGIGTIFAAKYYLTFAERLKRIFEDHLPNKFSLERIKSYYAKYPPRIVEMVEKENTPTITRNLKVDLLEKNFNQVVEAAKTVPSYKEIERILNAVGGYTKPSQIGLDHEQFVDTVKICCYIRNRFTMLRLVCDYELFDFDSEL